MQQKIKPELIISVVALIVAISSTVASVYFSRVSLRTGIIPTLVSVIDHIQTLGDNPDIGRIVSEFGEEKIRELIHSPFRIVYLREQHTIHLIRVWRSERLLVLPESKI